MYGNSNCGYKFYPAHLKVKVIRGSNEQYFSVRFLERYFSELLLAFVSAEGKADSYNHSCRDTEQTRYFQKFIHFNKQVGGHFKTKEEKQSIEPIDDEDDDSLDDKAKGDDDDGEEVQSSRSTLHELHRRSVQTGFYIHQVRCELEERGQIEEWSFGPKDDPHNPLAKISFKDSLELYMNKVDELRRDEIYQHSCSPDCLKRGCGSVVVMDGNWQPWVNILHLQILPSLGPGWPSGPSFEYSYTRFASLAALGSVKLWKN